MNGAAYNVQTGDGGAVGYNADTTVAPGQSLTYYWRAPSKEGLYYFHDQASLAGSEADGGSNAHGLFGALAVEPAGSRWYDPVSGAELSGRYPYRNVAGQSGELYINATIVPPAAAGRSFDGRTPRIQAKDAVAFREMVVISQDEMPGIHLQNCDLFVAAGKLASPADCADAGDGQVAAFGVGFDHSLGLGFNYGSEHLFMRSEPINRCPDCVGEETWLSSWPYGDPALVKLASGLGPWYPAWHPLFPGNGGQQNPGRQVDPEDCGIPTGCYTANVIHAYVHDATKVRFLHAGPKETHVFHMHAHQWLSDPQDVGDSGYTPGQPGLGGVNANKPQATTIDSQTYGPGEAFTNDVLFGAGSKPGTVGDTIFHCHLYPHFAEGFWALWRVHDALEDGTARTPDGILVHALLPLPDRSDAPAQATAASPGFPRFIPGEVGWRAPQPPLGVSEANGGVDDPATPLLREDLSPAPRFVAGQLIPQAKLDTEYGVMTRGGTRTPLPGAPLVDPCPVGARQVTYNISIIQTDVVYNEAGWHDPQGRIIVLDEDVDDVIAGRKAPEPFFFRVNAGDCINLNMTNRLPNYVGNDDFLELVQTNMVAQHIHLVKFDVTASDGASNGWNYQQAAYTEDQALFDRAILDGTPLPADFTVPQLRGAVPTCGPDRFEGIELVEEGCRLPLPIQPGASEPWFNPQWACGPSGCPMGQTLHERWFADYDLRTIFTHDHHFPAEDQNRGLYAALIVEPAGMDVRNSFTGEFYQPINDPAHGPVCGQACEGKADGTHLDIIGPGPDDDFREYALAIADFVSLYRPCQQAPCSSYLPGQEPLEAPAEPEAYPKEDPGVFGMNYRNAPFVLRNRPDIDPAYTFSSTVYGDPKTPLLEAYAGDAIRMRLIQGAQEEQHVVQIHGMRWRQEPDDPGSPLVDATSVGISEAFNFELPTMECGWDEDCQGDYLYSGSSTDDLWLGAWGLMRVYGRNRDGLLPLPDNIPQNMTGNVRFKPTGSPPPPANKPGTPCVPGAPTRSYSVIAVDTPITYNAAGDHDPYGLVYAVVLPGETVGQAAARVRSSNPEPMVIRANAGDCIEVTLTNMIDPQGAFAREHGPQGARQSGFGFDPALPLEPAEGTPAGLRVSLHAGLVQYDVRGSDGATIGYNRDQTVGPGERILYRWYAQDVTPGELGSINLTDYGDVRGHRHHGLFGALVIEPRGATYHDPLTGAEILSGAQADIRVPGQKDFREFALFYQDGLNLWDAAGQPILDPVAHPAAADAADGPAALDAEDSGEKGYSYRSERFVNRLGQGYPLDGLDGRALAQVFSSVVHGDPATPIFRAYAGDDVRLRLLQGADKPRQSSFALAGHSWLRQPFDSPDETERIGLIGGMSVGRSINIHVTAGGDMALPGDYRYGNGVLFFHTSGGQWGIMRVYDGPQSRPVFAPDALAAEDNPHVAGYAPLLPLEQVTIRANVFVDANGNLARGKDEAGLGGVTVRLRASDGTLLASALTDASGAATFQAARGAYDLEVAAPAGWLNSTAASLRVDASAENAQSISGFGLLQLGSAAVRLFNDRDGDGTQGEGEAGLAGWTVSLSQSRTPLASATSDGDGLVRFGDLRPGSYQASLTPPAGWFATTPSPAAVAVQSGAQADVGMGFATRAGLSVQLFNDSNGNGAKDAGESWLSGWRVGATGGPLDERAVSGRTNPVGYVTLDDPDPEIDGMLPGDYSISVGAGRDWSCAGYRAQVDGVAGARGDCAGNSLEATLIADTTQVLTVAMRNPNHWVVAEPFVDVNRNGVRDSGEGKLVGWQAELYRGATLLERGVTGNDGRVSWYRAGQSWAAGSYRVQITPPADAALPWVSTLPGEATSLSLDVIAGETGVARLPFVQLSTVSVALFHDQDNDGEWDDHEAPLANRSVIFYDKNRKTILAQGVTDAGGQVPFRMTAGRTYYVEAVLPSGWSRTAPVDGRGRGIQRLKVVAPKNGDSLAVAFGQYELNDTTPPPAPTFSAAPGEHVAPLALSFDSEDNVRYRYTLDGSTPSAGAGYPLVAPALSLAAAGPVTVRAVAIDAAGNVSPVAEATYTIVAPDEPLGAAGFSSGLSSWSVTRGGIAVGYLDDSHHADGQEFTLRSVKIGGVGYIDGYGSLTLPEGQRELASLRLIDVSRGNRDGIAKSYYLFNWASGGWELVWGPSTLDTFTLTESIAPAGDLSRFVSPAGEVRVRYEAWTAWGRATSFRWMVDQILVKTTYRP